MRILLVLILCATSTIVFAWEDTEPPIGYTLQVGGEMLRLFPGEEKKLSGNYNDPKICLIEDIEREFCYAGMSFKYPAYFSFEADVKSDEYKNWTLSGNDVKIMVFMIKGKFTPDTYVSGMKSKFGNKTKITDITHNLGGNTFKGKRVRINVADTAIYQDAFLISKGLYYTTIVIQDSPVKEKLTNKETVWVTKLLRTTFKISK